MAYIASRRRRGSRRMPQRNDEPDRVATWRTYARAAAASSAGCEEVESAVGVVNRAGPLVGGARRGGRAARRRRRQCRRRRRRGGRQRRTTPGGRTHGSAGYGNRE